MADGALSVFPLPVCRRWLAVLRTRLWFEIELPSTDGQLFLAGLERPSFGGSSSFLLVNHLDAVLFVVIDCSDS